MKKPIVIKERNKDVEYEDIDCLHVFDCIDEEFNKSYESYTYKCQICNQLRVETLDCLSQEITDIEIIKQGEILK